MAKKKTESIGDMQISGKGCGLTILFSFLILGTVLSSGTNQIVFALLLVGAVGLMLWFKMYSANKERKHELALAKAVNAGRIEIIYEDRRGDVSKRRISPIEIKQTDDKRWMITAFCELRHEERTFYADNIVRAIDCESGELITDVVPFIQARCSKQ